jgi:hypothetical protein
VRAIPPLDSRDLTHHTDEVAYVYRSGDDQFDHVLIPTLAPNVYLVVVVSRTAAAVYGHHLLDLNQKACRLPFLQYLHRKRWQFVTHRMSLLTRPPLTVQSASRLLHCTSIR